MSGLPGFAPTVSCLLSMALGAGFMTGWHAGFYDTFFAASIAASITFALLASVVFSSSKLLARAVPASDEVDLQGKQAEEALNETNRFLDAVIENIPSMVFVKDARTLAFTRVNRAAERLLGMSRDDLIGKSDLDFFPREQAEFFQAKDRDTLASGQMLEIPAEPIETGEGLRWLHTQKVPILGEDGTPAFLLGISKDITERRRLDEEMRLAREAAEATSRELEAFSYSVSHDLRAPLRSIDGFSQAILEDHAERLDEQGQDYLHRVRAAAQRMAELIDDLLKLSRVARSEMTLEDVNLSAMATETIDELTKRDPGRVVRTTIQKGIHAECDAHLVQVAMNNLLENAWKFSSKRAETTVEFGERLENGAVEYYVRDNGAGFDMAYVGKLFGAFQRLHSATEFEGTGIGLATVARIIHRHGGRVWTEAKPGEGATFFFTLGQERREES